jgi:cysteinyl-tRNA synthetase
MSKSAGNFLTVEEALKKYTPEALRFYFLSAHYRSPLDYSEEIIEQAAGGVKNLEEITTFLRKIAQKQAFNPQEDKELLAEIENYEKEIIKAMDNDFNTQMAFGFLNNLTSIIFQAINKMRIGEKVYEKMSSLISFIDRVFGIIPPEKEIPPEIRGLIQEREEARKQGDFKRADQLREKIKELGYEVEDTLYGPLVKGGN